MQILAELEQNTVRKFAFFPVWFVLFVSVTCPTLHTLAWYLLSIQLFFFPYNYFCWTAIWAAFQCTCFWFAVFWDLIWSEDKFHLSLLSVCKSLSWYFTKLSSICLACGFPQEPQIQSPFTCHATVSFFLLHSLKVYAGHWELQHSYLHLSALSVLMLVYIFLMQLAVVFLPLC